MSGMRRVGLVALVLLWLAGMLVGCTTPSASDVASQNVSTAADNFEVDRLIVGINLRTGENLFSVQGACSIARDGDLVVTCKTGRNPDTFAKHYVGLGEGVSWVSTQLGPVTADSFRTRIIWRPTTFVPDFRLDVGQQ